MIVIILTLFAKLSFEADKMEILRENASRVTHLVGSVHLYDKNLDIKGAEAWFNPSQNSLIVHDSLFIKAQDAEITGDSLYFDTEERTSYIFRNVVVTRGHTEIRAPRININHRTRSAHIPVGAQIRDKKEGILVTGGEVTYSLEYDRGTISRFPRMIEEGDSSSFTVTSERMHLDQKNQVASSAGEVKVVTSDVTVTCDSLDLFYNQDRGQAAGKVVITNPDGRITADSADFRLAQRELKEIFLFPLVQTRYRTEDSDSVVVASPNLTIDLKVKNEEILIFSGGTRGTYYWKEDREETE